MAAQTSRGKEGSPLSSEDEYTVPLCHHHGVKISFHFSSSGQDTSRKTVFCGYVGNGKSPEEVCNLIRNKGDIVLAIDGISTKGKTRSQIEAMLRESEKTRDFTLIRFRDVKHVPSYKLRSQKLADAISALHDKVAYHTEMMHIQEQNKLKCEEELEKKKNELRRLQVNELRFRQQSLAEIAMEIAASNKQELNERKIQTNYDRNESRQIHSGPPATSSNGSRSRVITVPDIVESESGEFHNTPSKQPKDRMQSKKKIADFQTKAESHQPFGMTAQNKGTFSKSDIAHDSMKSTVAPKKKSNAKDKNKSDTGHCKQEPASHREMKSNRKSLGYLDTSQGDGKTMDGDEIEVTSKKRKVVHSIEAEEGEVEEDGISATRKRCRCTTRKFRVCSPPSMDDKVHHQHDDETASTKSSSSSTSLRERLNNVKSRIRECRKVSY